MGPNIFPCENGLEKFNINNPFVQKIPTISTTKRLAKMWVELVCKIGGFIFWKIIALTNQNCDLGGSLN